MYALYLVKHAIVHSFVLAGYSACCPAKRELFGIPLEKDLLAGNVNFFKASEGYLESYPQAVYQLSITLRDQWPPSKLIDKTFG